MMGSGFGNAIGKLVVARAILLILGSAIAGAFLALVIPKLWRLIAH